MVGENIECFDLLAGLPRANALPLYFLAPAKVNLLPGLVLFPIFRVNAEEFIIRMMKINKTLARSFIGDGVYIK